jgi:hypothetical protein
MIEFEKQQEILVAEAKKQSRKLIDISDKGYNAYRLCLNFKTRYYSKNKYAQHTLSPKQDWWEGLDLGANVVSHTYLWERLVFLAPKDVDITLDNILEYCNFNYSYHKYIPFLFGEKPIRRRFYNSWTEYELISSPVLEKVETGKIPENVFNYIINHQKLYYQPIDKDSNKILVMLGVFFEGATYKWEQKAIDRVLPIFNQDPDEILNRLRKTPSYKIDLMTVEEFEKRFDEILA